MAGKRARELNVYNRKRWKLIRESILNENPCCVYCLNEGRHVAAQEIDHIVPLSQGGEPYDRSNLQPLCRPHHEQKTQDDHRRYGRADGGIIRGCDADGIPLAWLVDRRKNQSLTLKT